MKRHNSMRGYFAYDLYGHMKKDKDIFVLVGDLGFGMFDDIRRDFKDRFYNAGAAEQSMMGIAVGLAMSGKKPFVYSITPFLLWRPAETIRLYVDHESAPVRLVGSGRGNGYTHDGFSHNADDARRLLSGWKNIKQYWPSSEASIPRVVDEMVNTNKPSFVSLRR